MASIGSFTVTTMQGVFPRAQRAYNLIERPGVAGHGVQFDQWRVGLVKITTRTSCSTLAQANSVMEGYRKLIRSTVDVIDQFGFRWTNTLVVNADPLVALLAGPVPALVTTNWIFLPRSVAPA